MRQVLFMAMRGLMRLAQRDFQTIYPSAQTRPGQQIDCLFDGRTVLTERGELCGTETIGRARQPLYRLE